MRPSSFPAARPGSGSARLIARFRDRGHDTGVIGPAREPGRPWARGLGLLAVLTALCLSLANPPVSAAARLPRWTGGIDLYRSGVFSTQHSWLWCTAADVQIVRNIADRTADHSRSAQQRYFSYMRRHNRYEIPVADGVDPAGWAAGLRHYVDTRYELVTSGTFSSALRSAVRNLRLTNLPVGITVSHGNHAWILTGFTATADPAVTNRFTVTSVRVVGPLWGLQSRTYGYDMRPDTKLTRHELKAFFTPWHYAGVRMAWEGDWVSIQPVATAADRARAATPTPTVHATLTPPPTPPVSEPLASSSVPMASPAASAPVTSASELPPMALAASTSGAPTAPPTPRVVVTNSRDPASFDFDAGIAALVAVMIIASAGALWISRARTRHR